MRSIIAGGRHAAAVALEAVYDVAVLIYGTVFQGPTTDERPRGSRHQRVPVAEVAGSLRRCFGFGRLLLKVGGGTYTISGTIRPIAEGEVFTPSAWWRERGAVEVLLTK